MQYFCSFCSGRLNRYRKSSIEQFIIEITEGLGETEAKEIRVNLTEKIASREQIKPWTAYQERKNKKMASEKLPEDTAPEGYVTMTYTHKSDPKLNRSYLMDEKRILPPMRRPLTTGLIASGPRGAFKHVVERDESYIKLKGSRPNILDSNNAKGIAELTETQANKQRHAQLEELQAALHGDSFTGTSIAPGLLGVYSGKDGQLLAVNGGEDLQAMIFGMDRRQITLNKIPLKAYKQLCSYVAMSRKRMSILFIFVILKARTCYIKKP